MMAYNIDHKHKVQAWRLPSLADWEPIDTEISRFKYINRWLKKNVEEPVKVGACTIKKCIYISSSSIVTNLKKKCEIEMLHKRKTES